MSKGLRFTDEEEQEFQTLTRLTPRGFGQHLGVWADRIANTVGMFLVLLLFSLLAETVFRPVLNQMLFISNTYQLIALPILGIATGLSTTIILRFLFRIHLENRVNNHLLHARLDKIERSLGIDEQDFEQSDF